MLKRLLLTTAITGFAPLYVVSQAIADTIPEILVTARNLKPSANEAAYNTTILGPEEFASSAGARLDDVLRTVPGFALFRRQSSRAAHPTTQGITLRGLGPSGAGRTLVLLDGVPQNDPFGGWVDWSRLPSASLERAAITRGGGAGPWGNTALAGVVRLQTRTFENSGGEFEVSGGAHDTFDATAQGALVTDNAVFHALAHGHTTDGSFLIRKDQRGPVDRRAADEGGVVEVGAQVALDDDTSVRAVGRYSESELINGTDVAESRTRVADAALSILHQSSDATSWEANAYVRDQAFRAVFAAVNATRTTATSSLDQFAVPATAVGGNFVLRHQASASVSVDAGADVRVVEGDTNENFQNLGAGFTRVRKAGGEQLLAGAFTEVNWQATPAVLATIGGRVDGWRQSDGIRQESVLQTGALVRNDQFATRDGTVGTMRGALRYKPANDVTLKASAYNGFRLPTLNELYRPFRVGNDITEANAALGIEKIEGFDVGAGWAPTNAVSFEATYFYAVLKNAVTNVTVQTTPGLNAALGVTVPAGGVLRQRQNIDRIVTDGFEFSASAQVSPEFKASVSYLFTSPNVSESPQQRALEGLRLAQVPRQQATLQLRWTPTNELELSSQVRGATKQFDDDQNLRTLSGYMVVDATAQYAVTDRSAIYVAVENLFNRTIESGRSADGLVSVATPLTARAGARIQF